MLVRKSLRWASLGVGVLLALPTAVGAQVGFQQAQALNSGIAQKRAERSRRDVELTALRTQLTEAREKLVRRTRTLYRLQRGGLLPLGEGFAGLLTHQSRLDRLARLVDEGLGSVEAFSKRERALEETVAQLDRELAEATTSPGVMHEQLGPAEGLGTSSAAFLQAFAASEPQAMSTYVAPDGYGTLRVRDGNSISGQTFTELRGYLDLPVSASASVREGRRENGIGLEMLAPKGTTVRAVADGRIAFAGAYSSYGNLVIVDHGNNYFTVYGGLGDFATEVGAPVMRGSTLGQLGDAGPQSGLYFEVRRGTRALDAASWLGL